MYYNKDLSQQFNRKKTLSFLLECFTSYNSINNKVLHIQNMVVWLLLCSCVSCFMQNYELLEMRLSCESLSVKASTKLT